MSSKKLLCAVFRRPAGEPARSVVLCSPRRPLLHCHRRRARMRMSSLPSVIPRLKAGRVPIDRIDRLGWAAGTCIDTYGVRVGVRCNEPRVINLLEPRLPPGWKPAASPAVDRLFSLWVDPREERARRPSRLYAGRCDGPGRHTSKSFSRRSNPRYGRAWRPRPGDGSLLTPASSAGMAGRSWSRVGAAAGRRRRLRSS